MKRTTIVLPEDLKRRARIAAAERGVSVSALIREAVEEKLRQVRPRMKSLGTGYSEQRDVARKSGDLDFEPRSWR